MRWVKSGIDLELNFSLCGKIQNAWIRLFEENEKISFLWPVLVLGSSISVSLVITGLRKRPICCEVADVPTCRRKCHVWKSEECEINWSISKSEAASNNRLRLFTSPFLILASYELWNKNWLWVSFTFKIDNFTFSIN